MYWYSMQYKDHLSNSCRQTDMLSFHASTAGGRRSRAAVPASLPEYSYVYTVEITDVFKGIYRYISVTKQIYLEGGG